ncbi:sodium-dependent bicarbonate transport family permease [Devosia sp. XJ19-1]|uniref:Sodium-dependent bicarbonate transport family permease n=1 Tax=Devosia ureilytica TaxID=2952754 RepID=A0A9Q4FTW2_9HYPH|nr:sodium-dependent bicarbonate transport family permease [Devosia ureilytica]MCP8885434.1 sodium-dependent bicarbonate transport family permease [Devosia ureilytica]MCP8888099.1 sodium-dependent bicarbonate transport family permease [Devosia ureilytica]
MQSLLSPAILFFALGLLAALARSNLQVPEAIGKALAIYLMAAIGLKGGVQVSENGLTPELFLAGFAGLALSLLLPFPAYWAVRRLGGLDRMNAGAVAAHYGSVSVVTFVTGVAALEAAGIEVAGFMVAVLALMEAPAILVGLWLARRVSSTRAHGLGHHLSHTLRDGSILLLVGGFIIGMVAGRAGFEPVRPVFEGAFGGILCLFLLDMGLVAGRHLAGTGSVSPRLVALAIALAVTNGVVGLLIGMGIGLDAGSAAALAILAGSASYIAAPAAVRMALPEVDHGMPLTMSLAVTFPFNVLVAIPILSALAGLLS